MTARWGTRNAPQVNQVWERDDGHLWLIIEDIRYGWVHWEFDAFCLTNDRSEIVHIRVNSIRVQQTWKQIT